MPRSAWVLGLSGWARLDTGIRLMCWARDDVTFAGHDLWCGQAGLECHLESQVGNPHSGLSVSKVGKLCLGGGVLLVPISQGVGQTASVLGASEAELFGV